MKRELERIEIPGEDAARVRAWAVLEAGFAAWEPAPRRSHWPRVAAVALALTALLAAALSSPGRAVIDEIREVVGVERAQPALFSLPTPGRLLVASDAGIWVVQPDGSRRLLGDYREATWSPFGRFVAAVRENELVALEPDGDVRWTLARRGVRFPRWTGSEANTRIAYVSRGLPRVVAGDGTADQPVCAASTHPRVPPAWQPGPGFVLALAAPSGLPNVFDLDGCVARSFLSTPILGPRRLEWSDDATRLLIVTRDDVRVLHTRSGSIMRSEKATHAAFRPRSHELALIRRRGGLSEVVVRNRVAFRGTGEFRDLAWSPNGRWLLVTWPTADQWVFVRVAKPTRIVGVSDVTRQFGGFPRVEGWCCAP